MSQPGNAADATAARADAPDAGAGRPPRMLVAAAIVVLTVLLVAAAVLTILDRRADDRDQLASEAVSAAETAALAVLSYRPETVAEDLAAAEPLLTQPFLESFRAQSRDVTVPRATSGLVASSARSAGAALASAGADSDFDSATVVVFLDRNTVGRDQIPHVLQTVVEVGLVRDGDRWLVAEFTPR